MKHRMFRSVMGALLLTAALALTACSGESSSTPDTRQNSSESSVGNVYAPHVPDSKVDENTPGEKQEAKIGTTVSYQDKVTVDLKQVVELDRASNQEARYFVAEMTITNKTDEPLDCSTLTHFSAEVNGNTEESRVRDVTASVFARKYYTKLGSDMQVLNQAIDPGASITGYVYFSAPLSWDSFQLVYTPYKYYNTDKLLFEVTADTLTHYTEEL